MTLDTLRSEISAVAWRLKAESLRVEHDAQLPDDPDTAAVLCALHRMLLSLGGQLHLVAPVDPPKSEGVSSSSLDRWSLVSSLLRSLHLRGLNFGCLLVLLVIVDRAEVVEAEIRSVVTQDDLAAQAGLNKGNCRKVLQRLYKSGLVTCTARHEDGNHYTINLPKDGPLNA